MRTAISRTAPFRHLQKQIGSATYRLNTVLVGLELVADDGVKSPRLPVTWTKPSSPDQARNIADRASIFACTSALVLAADIFDQFLSSLAAEDWLCFANETKDMVTKTKTRPKDEGGAYSVAERSIAFLRDLHLPIGPTVGGVELLSKWRNVAVHTRDRKLGLADDMVDLITKSEDHFREHYSGLDIHLELKNFSERKNPVPKETTSLIAVVQNLSRTIDEAAIRRVAGEADLTMAVADKLLQNYFCNRDRKVPGWVELSEAWQGSADRRKANLMKIMQRVGFTETEKAVSAILPNSYIVDLVEAGRDEVAHRFRIRKHLI